MIPRSLMIIVLVLLSYLAGCARLPQQQPQPVDAELVQADSLQHEKKYREALDIYEKVAKDSSGTERGAVALFSAGKVRLLFDSPQKEYQRALQNFDEFLARYPNDSLAADAQAWRTLLKTVLDLRKENEHLSKSIEELKRVDIRQEERRRK